MLFRSDKLRSNGRALYDRQFSLQRFFTNVSRVHQRHFGIAAQLPESEVTH